MNRSEDILAKREQGQLHVSIGTSLALEGALGIHPDIETKEQPILKYNSVWINVATMFRNLFGSITAVEQDSVVVKDLAIALSSELPVIEGVVSDMVGRKTNIVFYRNDLSKMKHWFPHANIKLPTTPKQRIFASLRQQTLDLLPTYLDEVDYRQFDGKIKGDRRALILTHSPIDLLSYPSFDELVLLESHTGKLKSKSQWGNKLGVKDETLPFNTFTLQVFGDGTNFLSPLPIKYRRVVLDLAKSDRWTPITTVAKIRAGLSSIKDSNIRQELLKVLESRSF